MKIRACFENDYIEIADLFHGSIHAIDRSLYSEQELEAWAPSPPDYDRWKNKVALTKPYIARKNEAIVGFIELESNGHIDCLYVHKDCQRQGIASALLRHVQEIAYASGVKKLHVEASKVAVPMFKKHGFTIESANVVELRGQKLVNYRMCSVV